MVNPVFKTTSSSGTATTRRGYALEFKAGEYVFREGELGLEMYIINEGKVEILNHVGDEEQILAVLEKGDFFGEMSVLEDLPRAATARAATDVRLLQINGSTFDQLLQGNPEIAVRMMRKLSRRLRETDEMIKSLLGFIAPDRGQMRVLGLDVARSPLEIRARVGYMPETDGHIPGMNAVSFVAYCGELAGLPRVDAMQRAHEVLFYVGLGEARYRA